MTNAERKDSCVVRSLMILDWLVCRSPRHGSASANMPSFQRPVMLQRGLQQDWQPNSRPAWQLQLTTAWQGPGRDRPLEPAIICQDKIQTYAPLVAAFRGNMDCLYQTGQSLLLAAAYTGNTRKLVRERSQG